MAGSMIIRGGDVWRHTGNERADVAIVDGVIVAIGRKVEAPSGAVEVDASGCVIAPGLVDLLADLGGPNDLERETPTTGSAAAALGGFTSVLIASTPNAPIDSAAALAARRALDPGLVRLHYAAAMTVGHRGETLSPMAELAAAGVRWFADTVDGCANTDLLRNAFEYASGLAADIGFALPVEDPSFARDGVMHEGAVSSAMGVPGRPEIAERMGAERLVALAELTGARMLLGPFSSKAAVECTELRCRAVDIDDRVHTHTTPAHLLFTDAACAGYDTGRRFDPPLRPDTLAAWLGAGYLDCISSGHRPHPAQEVELPFDQAPAGGASLEQAFAAATTARFASGSNDDRLPEVLDQVIERMTRAAGLLGAPTHLAEGQQADLCVVDFDAEWTIPVRPHGSLATTTPYGGIRCETRVRHTIVNGVHVVSDSELVRDGGAVNTGLANS